MGTLQSALAETFNRHAHPVGISLTLQRSKMSYGTKTQYPAKPLGDLNDVFCLNNLWREHNHKMYKIGCTEFHPRKRCKYRRVKLLRSYLAFESEERLRFSLISNKILLFPLLRRCKIAPVSLVVLLTGVPGCVLWIPFWRILGFGSATRPKKVIWTEISNICYKFTWKT
jgi:hypothetical protein